MKRIFTYPRTSFFLIPSQTFKTRASGAFALRVIFFLIFTLSGTTLLAQPTIQWENTIQATEEEEFAVVKQTQDGGYILGGTSSSNAGLDKTENSRGSADYWLVKLDAAGVKEWDKRFGGNATDYLTSVHQTADGGYMVSGWSDSGVNGDKNESNRSRRSHTWILKLDPTGTKEWDKTLEYVGSIVELTPDGGFILGGNGVFMKVNASGNYVWVNTTGIAGNYFKHTNDGGIIIMSSTLAVKLNASGIKQWEQPLAGEAGYDLFRPTADGGYIMGDGVFGIDYKILKLNAAGTKEWEKIIGGNSVDDLRDIIQTADGGYILGGFSHSGAGGDKSENNKGPRAYLNNFYYSDYWIVKLDAAGNRVWDRTIGGIFHEQLRSLEQTADGGLIIGGRSDSPGKANTSEPYASLSDKSENSSSFDYWVVKLSNVNTAPPTGFCNLALTSKVIQAEPWYGLYPGGGGGIDLSVTGGTPPYNYTWNNFRNSPEDAPAPVLAPGVYQVVVTDAKGCTALGRVEVGKKNDPMRLYLSSLNVTTAGDPVGSIDLSVVGGTGPYKYLWSNGVTTEDLTGLGVGTYSVMVTDAMGTKATASVNIINPRNPTPTVICSLALTTNVKQAEPWYGMWGPTNGAGAIDLTVSGGLAPYTYAWNAGVKTEDLPTATPGRYSVTVTDAKGCSAITTVYVGRKNSPMTLSTAYNNVSRAGGSDGSVDLSVLGGVGPLTYRWSHGATTEDLTGLAAGTYTVSVTDAIGKTATTSVTVSAPGGVLALTAAHKDVTKVGADDGFIDLTVTGGVGPYTYRWNAGATTQDLIKVIAGLYTVTVTDAAGATATLSVRVMAPATTSAMASARKPELAEAMLLPQRSLTVYPNPATSQTTIAFNLAEAGAYTIELFDIRGAKIKTLAAGNMRGREAEAVTVELEGMAEGIYLLRLMTDKGVATKRLQIQR